MADVDNTNPYVVEAVARGVSEGWIADFLTRNPGDYHRILAAASFDNPQTSNVNYGSSNVRLTTIAPVYQEQVRPWTAAPVQPPGAVSQPGLAPVVTTPNYYTGNAPITSASLLGLGSGQLLIAAALAAYWFLFRK